jgi:hypothetical protein
MSIELLYSALFDLHESNRLCREVLGMVDSTTSQRERVSELMDRNVKKIFRIEGQISPFPRRMR